jgi:hypothetical protein
MDRQINVTPVQGNATDRAIDNAKCSRTGARPKAPDFLHRDFADSWKRSELGLAHGQQPLWRNAAVY